MFGLNFDDFFEFRLIEVLASILKNIVGFFLEDFEQKYGDHILEFWMFTQISLVINSILDFFIIKQSCLSPCESFVADNIVLIVMFLPIVHVVDLVLVEFFLFLLVLLRIH